MPAEQGTRDGSGRAQQAALAMGLLRAANTGSASPSTPKEGRQMRARRGCCRTAVLACRPSPTRSIGMEWLLTSAQALWGVRGSPGV